MVSNTTQATLYERDFALWIEDTVARLKAREVDNLDWDNLVEEIEALGISQKHEVESRLKTILAHILKRCYVLLPDCFRGWQVTIRTQRNDLKRLLKKSPSLRNHLLVEFDEVYQEALEEVREEYPETEFPETWNFSHDLDAILTEIFWESEV
ncbi:DUF29 domain-containing protein [Microseira wollei]|uniref:DUF29 domain-containing protein n=1 Tax=Microseira wollei NIES-4236 TaxID=2530354 RepID=A0AAV3X5M2_9CYAN|nr:DUF29 domain-containing protein [Microseira wollei]GET35895.1 protein of unknown function DUF29 [Microseira wollei NIES-4236]